MYIYSYIYIEREREISANVINSNLVESLVFLLRVYS